MEPHPQAPSNLTFYDSALSVPKRKAAATIADRFLPEPGRDIVLGKQEAVPMQCRHTRRQWLSTTAGALSGAWLAGGPLARAAQAPTAPVAVSRCKTYNPAELVPALANYVRPTGRIGPPGQGQNRRHQDQSDRRAHLPDRLPSARGHALYQPASDRRRRAPHGQSRRASHPHSGESLVHRRSGGGIRDAGQLGAARHPGRRPECGVRKHQLSGTGQEILAHGGAAWRLHLSRLSI